MPQVPIYLGGELYEALIKASKKTGKTPSKITQEAIIDFIAENFIKKPDGSYDKRVSK